MANRWLLFPIINTKALDELTTHLKEKRYRITATWRVGTQHKVADALSRHPVVQPSTEDQSGNTEIEHVQHVLHQIAKLELNTGDRNIPNLHICHDGATGSKDQEYLELIEAIVLFKILGP